MALINCPECNREISDKAVSCPHCGCPIKNVNNIESDIYTLKLNQTPLQIKAIRIVRELFGYGLKEAKDIVDSSPVILAENLSYDEVKKLAQPFCNNLISIEILDIHKNPVDIGVRPQPPQNKYYNYTDTQPVAQNINIPKCPTCNSTSIKKISLSEKAVGGAMFGLFSSKVRKTFECKSCGYKW
jgi:ribosomal protein L7/L12